MRGYCAIVRMHYGPPAMHESLERIAALLTAAESVAAALQAARETGNESWERYCNDPAIDALLSACADLEHELERE